MRTIRVGSRESKLAVVQSELVMAALRQAHPDISLELITMKTTGDIILDRTLDKIGGKGLFVKELDQALLDGRIDIAVHSCKDLPMETDPRIPLVAFTTREDGGDVLCLPQGATELDPTKPIGSSSARRTMQLKALFPHMAVAPVRGNVITRLRKLDDGEFSALVLAGAGLKRLGLEDRISRRFTPEEMVPAAGQGILAIQARANEDVTYLNCLADPISHPCVLAERAFVAAFGGGCSEPVGAYGVVTGDNMELEGIFRDAKGEIHRSKDTAPLSQAEALGKALANRMLAQGGKS